MLESSYTDIVEAQLPRVTQTLSPSEQIYFTEKSKQLLHEKDAVLIAHYYTPPEIQALAEETNGFIGDSLAMAQFGQRHEAKTLVIAGVKFMGETAKILSQEKTVIMPTMEATCSLDLNCPIKPFSAFCEQHPDRTVVVYANTSAAVKARADWVVTSSIALQLIEHLHQRNEKIIWASDRYLGAYLQKETGADMLLWNGACIVHEEFKAKHLSDLKYQYPEAAVLVHPESPMAVIEMADVVGSTSQLLKAVTNLPNKIFLVATEEGIFYKMKQAAPDKTFILAPTAGKGGTCRSCGYCPWMKMNNSQKLFESLKQGSNEIIVDEAISQKALFSVQRMLDFAEENGL